MIKFLTLFFGLTVGMYPVGLEVEEGVAVVELHLDGRPVTKLTGPPWRAEIDPSPLYTRQIRREMFVHSERRSSAEGGLLRLSLEVRRINFSQQIAHAVAMAGLLAHGSHHRRMVVLLLGEEVGDMSQQTPASARHFLQDLQVPLVVWTLRPGETEHPHWGAMRFVGEKERGAFKGHMRHAVNDLRQELASQRIVWVQGHHLPQQIELSPAAKGIRLAGRD